MRNPTIRVQEIISRTDGVMYVAHGPDGHEWMLKRTTAEAAARDGLAYFLATRTLHDGRWVLSNPDGTPYRSDGA